MGRPRQRTTRDDGGRQLGPTGVEEDRVAEQQDEPTRGEPSLQVSEAAVPEGLARQMGRLARLLEAQDSTDAMLDEVVAAAVRLVPGTEEGSISVVTDRSRVSSRHASSDLPERVDRVQSETGQGPCLDAVFEQHTVRVPDLRTEQRWPLFARRAYEAGAGSMLSFQLYVEGDNLGALNLYSRVPAAFDDDSEEVGLLFAAHAAVAFAGAKKIDDLHRAVWTRDLIGQAKGMLMQRFDIDSTQAFRLLTRLSQNSHRKLRDIAEELATTRRLDVLERLVDQQQR